MGPQLTPNVNSHISPNLNISITPLGTNLKPLKEANEPEEKTPLLMKPTG